MSRIGTAALALSLFLSLVPAMRAQSFRVATSELTGLETARADAQPSEEETRQLRQIANSLKPLDAEILVLHGIGDRTLARRLASALRPGSYQVAFHGSFRKTSTSSALVGPPITILTRKQPFASRALEWRATGQLDWPGGFAFVGVHSGTNTLCLYVAHLPAEPASFADRENLLMARRRDAAAQYLVHHANWISSTLSNQLVSALVTGDFIINPRTGQSEGAVRILRQAGFKIAVPKTPLPKVPGATESESETPLQLTALLARNAELISTAQVTSRKAGAPSVASYEVATMPTVDTLASNHGAARATPPKVVALDTRIVWLWGGGILALSIATLFSVWLLRRAFSNAGMLRRGNPAVVLDLGSYQGRDKPYAYPRPGESYSGSTPDSANAAAVWQARAVEAEHRAKQAAAFMRPQLSRLLRERLIAWLSFQRSALITSQEMGTQQVLEMESRLQQVQGQLQERLRNREERIADLEREILAKEKIIRDLLRTQVRLAHETPEDAEIS